MRDELGRANGFGGRGEGRTDLCQCFVIASVESMIVPSMSNRTPANRWTSGGPAKASGVEPISTYVVLRNEVV